MGRRVRSANNLVCEYLENVSRSVLENYPKLIRQFIRHRHGIYALYHGNRLYYVGLASNLRSRLDSHFRNRHAGTWDRFSVYLTLNENQMRELEALLIRISKPKGNSQMGRFARANNLARQFKRNIKDYYAQEIRTIFDEGSDDDFVEEENDIEGRRPILSGYDLPSRRLRLLYRGRKYRARVLKDGSIKMGSRRFTSPSLAAMAIFKRPANGWKHWKYQRAPGDWVLLDTLRK